VERPLLLRGLLYIIYQAPPKARIGLDRLKEGPNPRYRVLYLGRVLLLLNLSTLSKISYKPLIY